MTSKGKKSRTTAKRTSGDWPNYVRTSERVALFYRDWGAGKPLLFLSGWTLNSDMCIKWSLFPDKAFDASPDHEDRNQAAKATPN
jgi:hypothetical protein